MAAKIIQKRAFQLIEFHKPMQNLINRLYEPGHFQGTSDQFRV